MSIRVDTSGLREFKEKLENFDTEALCVAIENELAARLLREVKRSGRTPVDTGELWRNWQVGSVVKEGDKYTVEVYNSTEYAEWVEFGHRQTPGRYVPAIGKRLKKPWVQGKFMLTVSTREIDNIKDRLIRQRVEQKFREVL